VTKIVVDTDVLAHLYAESPEAPKFQQHLRDTTAMTSYVSIAELHFGARSASWDEKAIAELDRYLRNYRVVPYSNRLPRLFARLRTQAVRSGHPLGEPHRTNDLWAVASAVHAGASLLTSNAARFAGFPGLTVLS
jgi:predicted nucleic acid-binding protein